MAELNEIKKSLDNIKVQMIEGIEKLLNERLKGANPSMNLDYYCSQGIVARYNFLSMNRDGYGVATFVDAIEKRNNGYYFVMCNEDGEHWEDRDTSDFDVAELLRIWEMLRVAFEEIDAVHNGKVLPRWEYDYYEIEGEEEGEEEE